MLARGLPTDADASITPFPSITEHCTSACVYAHAGHLGDRQVTPLRVIRPQCRARHCKLADVMLDAEVVSTYLELVPLRNGRTHDKHRRDFEFLGRIARTQTHPIIPLTTSKAAGQARGSVLVKMDMSSSGTMTRVSRSASSPPAHACNERVASA